jgi:hypothetical protein
MNNSYGVEVLSWSGFCIDEAMSPLRMHYAGRHRGGIRTSTYVSGARQDPHITEVVGCAVLLCGCVQAIDVAAGSACCEQAAGGRANGGVRRHLRTGWLDRLAAYRVQQWPRQPSGGESGTQLTAVFGSDGVVSGASCNTYAAPYRSNADFRLPWTDRIDRYGVRSVDRGPKRRASAHWADLDYHFEAVSPGACQEWRRQPGGIPPLSADLPSSRL